MKGAFIVMAASVALATAETSTEAGAKQIGWFKLPWGKSLHLTLPDGWQETMETSGPNPPITAKYSSPSSDRWIFMVSALFDPFDPEKFDKKIARETVDHAADEALAESLEKKIKLQEIEGPRVTGYYFRATDKDAELEQEDDYRYIIQGMAAMGAVGMTFTLLTNDDDAALIDSALNVIRSAEIASSPSGASAGPEDTELYLLTLPGKSWSVRVAIPGFKVSEEKTRPGNTMTMMMASNDASGVIISMFLELEQGAFPAEECRKKYYDPSRLPFPVKAVRRYESGDYALGEHVIEKAQGLLIRQMNVNAFRGIEDVCLHIHLSKVMFEEEERDLFGKIIESVRVVPVESSTSR